MDDRDITRLVVGPVNTVVMGRPVGQNVAYGELSNALRWKGGKWHIGAPNVLEKLRGGLVKPSPVLRLSARKAGAGKPAVALAGKALQMVRAHWRTALGLSAFILVMGIGFGAVVTRLMSKGDDLPVKASTEEHAQAPVLQAIRSVDEPFPMPSAEPAPASSAPVILPEGNQADEAPLPLRESPAQPSGPLKPTPPAQIIPSTTVSKVTVQPSPAQPRAVTPDPRAVKALTKEVAKETPKESGSEQAKDSATDVILDNEPPVRAAPQPQKEAPAPHVAPPQTAVAPHAAKGSGLVAITPDGKAALFTNPRTRLPEQFKVGDKLVNGEIVKSIDTKVGKVVTDKREYILE